MWLDIADKGRLINLDYIHAVVLGRDAGGEQWVLTATNHVGVEQPLATYRDRAEATRALDRVRHALQTIVLTSDGA